MLKLLVFTLLASQAAADPATCKSLADRLPGRLVFADRVSRTTYEDDQPGYGYGVQYRATGQVLTVFFYDLGRAHFSAASQREILDTSIDAAADSLGDGGFRLNTLDRGQRDGAVHYTAQGTDTADFAQFFGAGAVDGCFLKIRYTAKAPYAGAALNFTNVLDAIDRIY